MPTLCFKLSLSPGASQPLCSPPREVGGGHCDRSGWRGVSVWCLKLCFGHFLPLLGPCQPQWRRRYVRSATRLMAAPAEARAQRLLAYTRGLWRSLRPCPALRGWPRAPPVPAASPQPAPPLPPQAPLHGGRGLAPKGAWPPRPAPPASAQQRAPSPPHHVVDVTRRPPRLIGRAARSHYPHSTPPANRCPRSAAASRPSSRLTLRRCRRPANGRRAGAHPAANGRARLRSRRARRLLLLPAARR